MYKYDISSVCKPFNQEDLKEGRLYLYIYYADTSLKVPFIQYLLYKYHDGPLKDTLIIPFIEYSKTHSLENQLRLFFAKVFEESIEGFGIEIKGLLGDDHLFIDITNYMQYYKERLGIFIQSTDNWLTVTINEIINVRHVYHYSIHESITALFIDNPSLLVITHKKKIVDTPIVVYNGYSYNRGAFVSIFGKNKSFSNGRYGTYYYYTDYEGSLYYIKKTIETMNPDRVGIVRSILFTKKKYVVLNNPSEHSRDLSEINSLNNTQKERLSKIYDPYGEWGNNYNTLFVYKPILDNGSALDDPLTIVSTSNDITTVLNWGEINKTDFLKKRLHQDKFYIK